MSVSLTAHMATMNATINTSSVVIPSDNLGSALTPADTLPTVVDDHIQFASGTSFNTNYSSIPSIANGDTIVAAISSVSLDSTAIDFTQDAGNPTWLDAKKNDEAVASRFWHARLYKHLYDTANPSDLIGGNANNRLVMFPQVACRDLGDEPVQLDLTILPVANTGLTTMVGNIVTFPVVDVPEGWTFLFGVNKWGASGSNTWVGATQVGVGSTTLLNDGYVTVAKVDGESLGLNVTWEDTSGQMATSGGIAWIIAIPGVTTPLTFTETIDSLSPVMWLKLNDASGNAADYGSRGVAATPTGSPSYQSIAGPDGGSYVVLSGGIYFSLPDAADLGIDSATGKTFIASYRNTTNANNMVVLGKLAGGADRDYGIFARTASSGRMHANRYQDGGTTAYIGYDSPATSPTLSQWHTILVRYNTDGTISIWQDSATEGGVLQNGPTGTAEQDATQPLIIGAMPAFGGYNMVGAMAHVAMWNTALSTTDCNALMAQAVSEGWATT